MRPQKLVVAETRPASEPAPTPMPSDLLSLIDAIEQKLALAREAVKSQVQASTVRSGSSLRPGECNDDVRPARPTRDLVGDEHRKD